MLAILPFLVFSLIFLNLAFINTFKKLIFREKIIASFIIWSLLFVFITELLSLFNLITLPPVAFSWFAAVLILILGPVKHLSLSKLSLPGFKKIKTARSDFYITLIFAFSFIIFLTTFILAVSVAPNDIDGASYHLARVMHWIQNRDVYFYPTNIQIQSFLGVFASYVQLHFYILSGSDWFTNVIQWVFSIGALIGVTLLAKMLGADLKGQILAAFVWATIPMGILQASAAHDPHIISFFLVCFIYFSLKFLNSNKYPFIFLSGAALGLAWFTKQTAYVYSAPFIIWVLWLNIKKFGLKRGFLNLFLLALITILPNLLFYIRNFQFSGLPIFSIDEGYINYPIAILSFITNAIKNLALHFSTPFLSVNFEIHKFLTWIFNALNVDENSPGLNWKGQIFGVPPYSASEYTAPNTIHLLLFIISAIFLFREKRKGFSRGYFWSIIAAFALFSAIFRWQSAGSHIEFTLFVLASVIIGMWLAGLRSLPKYILIIILGINSLYFLFFNISKPIIAKTPAPLIPREEQYFIYRKELYRPYKSIVGAIKSGGYKNVGVIFVELRSDFEYPLWVLLKEDNKNIRIEHVDVKNSTNRFSKNFKPDIVVFLGTDKGALKKYLDSKVPIVGLN